MITSLVISGRCVLERTRKKKDEQIVLYFIKIIYQGTHSPYLNLLYYLQSLTVNLVFLIVFHSFSLHYYSYN